jgi:sigma-B regulation protein RsbU (phosphoserine phosphatase)
VQKNTFSLRYKILILLTVIPLITLSVYLVLAMKVFQDDKVAYVYDSSSKFSNAVSAQIGIQLNSVLSSNKFLFQEYLNSQNFNLVAKNFFKNENTTDLVAVYEIDEKNKGFKYVSHLEKFEGNFSNVKEKLESILRQEIYYVNGNKRIIYSLFNDERLLFFEKLPPDPERGNKAIYFSIMMRAGDLFDLFSTVSSQKIYLLNNKGFILLGPQETIGTELKKNIPLKFLDNNESIQLNGVEATKDQNNQEYFISFAQVGIGGLTVVSAVLKSKALSALDILLKKSIIFFVLLIAVTAIVSLIASSTITTAITQLFQATKQVSEGKFDMRVHVKSSDEVGVLADNFNKMAEEVSRLLDQTAEKARMENELQTAKTVQETLFPETIKKISNLEIAGFYEPASECGGDWWHYCEIGQRVFFWIGDATGHGAPSALITSAAKSAAVIIETLDVGPGKAMEYLNKCIFEVSRGRLMMTFFIGCYDKITGIFTYSNASHETPFLLKKSEKALKKKELIPLNEVNNPRLGQSKDTEYQESCIPMDQDDLVFFYTDGIPDIRNSKDEPWGEREFVKAIIKAHFESPDAEKFVNNFSHLFQEYRQGKTLVDDVTFFVVKNKNKLI